MAAAGDANRDGVRSASHDEFIELVNTTTHDIDISGYRIFTRGTAGSDTLRHTFAAGTILRAVQPRSLSSAAAMRTSIQTIRLLAARWSSKLRTGGLTLGNSGGVITLQDQTRHDR